MFVESLENLMHHDCSVSFSKSGEYIIVAANKNGAIASMRIGGEDFSKAVDNNIEAADDLMNDILNGLLEEVNFRSVRDENLRKKLSSALPTPETEAMHDDT